MTRLANENRDGPVGSPKCENKCEKLLTFAHTSRERNKKKFHDTVSLKLIWTCASWIKVDHINLYLTSGPRGDGCLPGCGSEPSQHRQVSEQPQNHGPRHQAERQIWSTTTAVDRKRTKAKRGVDMWWRATTQIKQGEWVTGSLVWCRESVASSFFKCSKSAC